jgi:hypothetical protein
LTESDLLIVPEVAPPELEGEHDRMAHIVLPEFGPGPDGRPVVVRDAATIITEAMVMGTPVQALCGKMWVPDRNPDNHGVCPTCIEVFEAAMGRPWTGRR